MNHLLISLIVSVSLLVVGASAKADELAPFRPPAVPLVTHDPYFSVWSMADHLTDEFPKHWTGDQHVMAMCGMVRIDGKPYGWAGQRPRDVPAMEQKRLEVLPTRTVYEFEAGGVGLTVTFLSPLLPYDLDVLSRPVTYLTWEVRPTDGKAHEVSIYLDTTGEWAVNDPAKQSVIWSRAEMPQGEGGLVALRIGSKDQPVLAKKGDNLRIDWGHLYLAAPASARPASYAGGAHAARMGFVERGELPKDEEAVARPANERWPTLAISIDLGKVDQGGASRHVLIGYDDEYSIQYMGKNLRPWWRRNGHMDGPKLLTAAELDYASLNDKCKAFDEELLGDLRKAGGEKYARLCSLAFRQCLAAHKLVASEEGRNAVPYLFSKENFSNGCIDTVDVTYPSSPFFLLFNPTLLKGQLTPIMEYAQSSGRWHFPFAPHDLGTYPLANGQVYGGKEQNETNQMPVEESGNILIMVAALAHSEGNADYAAKYWPTLTKWANYLKDKGLDPENQLCTDDFAGHLAHNTNLSIKAIVALAGYAQLCDDLGHKEDAAAFRKLAEGFAAKWQEMADDGDHYRLTFDKPGTWSQKYNLVWDKLLGMHLFPPAVARKEVAYYKTVQNRYGLPLDNRKGRRRDPSVHYTKLDWLIWSATLADNPDDFRAIADRAYDFANDSPTRVPLSDWYDTNSAKKVGFQARSVVGGVFIKLLEDPGTWKKWSSRSNHAN